MRRLSQLLFVVALALAAPALASAGTIQVPEDYATIQQAVDMATAGDQIRVGPGSWCGATITKPVHLTAEGGATIIGCPAPGPGLQSGSVFLRIGFFLPNGSASGTTVRHFTFDGRGWSDFSTMPLAFAVFARDAHDIIVEHNHILGTIQSITNTRGSGWTVSHNAIDGLTSGTCDTVCGGGDGIVFQQRNTSLPRALDNTATFNTITGMVPAGLDEFDMAGIILFGQDGAVIKNNKIAIAANPDATGSAIAILVDDDCCGVATPFLTSVNSVIVNNDGRDTPTAVLVGLSSGGATGNSAGTTLRGNFGVNDINGSLGTVRNRSVHTLLECDNTGTCT